MYAQDYLDRQNKIQKIEAARDRAFRTFRGCVFLFLMLAFGMGFCVFGWTGVNITPPASSDIPLWLWNGTFAVTTIGCLGMSGYCLFEALDDLFFSKNDPRRILRSHQK